MYSYPPLNIFPPSSSYTIHPSPKPTRTNTTASTRSILFYGECGGRLLLDLYHEYIWVLCCDETISSLGMFVDMVCDRVECFLGDGEFALLCDVFEVWRVQFFMIF